MKYSHLLVLFFIILTFGCRQGVSHQSSKCKYGAPQAIFNKGQAGIQQHRFQAQGNEATEEVLFSDGLELTLVQSGCNEIRQEFQFKLSGDFQGKETDFWIDKTIELLRRLGGLGLNYSGFSDWARLLEDQKSEIKLAESTALQPGFYASIDRIVGKDNATLVLTLSDQP